MLTHRHTSDSSDKRANQNGKSRKLSDSSNSTVVETVKLIGTNPSNEKPSESSDPKPTIDSNGSESTSTTKSSQKQPEDNKITSLKEEEDDSAAQKNDEEDATVNDIDDEDNPLQEDLQEDGLSNGGRKSCMSSRRSSSKSSIKKRVNYSESQEVIPSPPPPIDQQLDAANYLDENGAYANAIDDDEVFSDSVPAKFLRGDMCTPYPKKRSSIPGVFALPDWFADDR